MKPHLLVCPEIGYLAFCTKWVINNKKKYKNRLTDLTTSLIKKQFQSPKLYEREC